MKDITREVAQGVKDIKQERRLDPTLFQEQVQTLMLTCSSRHPARKFSYCIIFPSNYPMMNCYMAFHIGATQHHVLRVLSWAKITSALFIYIVA